MPNFLNDALQAGRTVKVITINGYQMEGKITDVDIHFGAITLDVDGKERFIMISAISTII